MRKGDIIILSDGQKATVIFGDESNYQYSCIVKLEVMLSLNLRVTIV